MRDMDLYFPLIRDKVDSVFGKTARTSCEFGHLAEDILRRTGKSLSPSTLKRFWAYVSSESKVSLTTLNILANYAGYASFSAFCSNDSSQYLNTKALRSSQIDEGSMVEIAWKPDRVVRLRHITADCFEVVSSTNSKLKTGDRFECDGFVVGFPLYLNYIERGGERTPAYAAGTTGGLSSCVIV